jgi:hypothetical protein
MPGLFGDGPNPLSELGGLFGAFAEGASPARAQQAYTQRLLAAQLQSLAQMPEFQGPGGIAKALATIQNPELQKYQFQQLPQQHQLEETLKPTFGPQGAALGSQQPGLLGPLFKPEKLEPGGSLVSPMQFPGMGGGGNGAPSIAGADAALATGAGGGTPAPPSGASGGPHILAENNKGIIGDEPAENAVAQRLIGDKSAYDQMGSGMGPLGKLNLQKLKAIEAQRMKEQGITPGMLAERTAKFPAFADAVKKRTEQGSNMGQAAMEFQDIWPKFMDALKRVNSSQFPTFNALEQFVKQHAGDPNVAELSQYIDNTLPSIYGRAISGTTQRPLLDDKRAIREGLNKFWNTGQMQAAGVALDNEFRAAREANAKQINVHKSQFGMGDPIPAEIQAQIQQAMAANKPLSKLIERLQEHGYDTRALERGLK